MSAQMSFLDAPFASKYVWGCRLRHGLPSGRSIASHEEGERERMLTNHAVVAASLLRDLELIRVSWTCICIQAAMERT
jgi:hypothetical protein